MAARDLRRRRAALSHTSGDCLSVNCGIPSFRFSAEQIERECGPRILGLARSIRSLVANAKEMQTQHARPTINEKSIARTARLMGEEDMRGTIRLGLRQSSPRRCCGLAPSRAAQSN